MFKLLRKASWLSENTSQELLDKLTELCKRWFPELQRIDEGLREGFLLTVAYLLLRNRHWTHTKVFIGMGWSQLTDEFPTIVASADFEEVCRDWSNLSALPRSKDRDFVFHLLTQILEAHKISTVAADMGFSPSALTRVHELLHDRKSNMTGRSSFEELILDGINEFCKLWSKDPGVVSDERLRLLLLMNPDLSELDAPSLCHSLVQLGLTSTEVTSFSSSLGEMSSEVISFLLQHRLVFISPNRRKKVLELAEPGYQLTASRLASTWQGSPVLAKLPQPGRQRWLKM